MVKNISIKITHKLIERDIVEKDNKEIYNYGFEVIISSFLIFIGIIVPAIVLGCFIESIIFIIFFCGLRINAGGYHAKTHLKCYVYFVISCFGSIVIANVVTKNISYSYIFLILISIQSVLLIIMYAPKESENKPISNKNKYKKNSIKTILFQVVLIVIIGFCYKNLMQYCIVAVNAVLIEGLTLLPIINENVLK